MTNEEIEKAITVALAVDVFGPNAHQPDMPLDYMERLADAARALVSQALGEVEQDLLSLVKTTEGAPHAALHHAVDVVRARREGFSLVDLPVS